MASVLTDRVANAKARVRWFVLHGLFRSVARRYAKRGDLQARLIIDEDVRPNPFPIYEQIRARGPLSTTRIGYITTSHELCGSVLRSDEFVTTSVTSGLPKPLAAVERATRTFMFHPVEPPSDDSPDAVREFTQRCTDVLEMYVRRHPELWLWMHRRWRDAGAAAEQAPGMFPSASQDLEADA